MTEPRTYPLLTPAPQEAAADDLAAPADAAPAPVKPARHDDPTRYGDWELSGKCVDF